MSRVSGLHLFGAQAKECEANRLIPPLSTTRALMTSCPCCYLELVTGCCSETYQRTASSTSPVSCPTSSALRPRMRGTSADSYFFNRQVVDDVDTSLLHWVSYGRPHRDVS